MVLPVLILAALVIGVVTVVLLARVHPRNSLLTMVFGFLLVLAGGLLMLATRGIPPGEVFFGAGLLLLASGVAVGALRFGVRMTTLPIPAPSTDLAMLG